MGFQAGQRVRVINPLIPDYQREGEVVRVRDGHVFGYDVSFSGVWYAFAEEELEEV